MDYAALKTYIEADPVFADHVASGWDAEIARIINERTVPVLGSVSRARFAMWCGATGLRAVIQDHADNPTSQLRSIALTLLDFLQGGVSDSLDMADASNQAMLAAWVSTGEITQPQADELLAMATTDQPIFGQPVHHLDIAKALRG